MPTNKRLGKGIEALISTYNTQDSDSGINTRIKLKNIIPNKNQPRKIFNDKAMEDLINSIKEKGIIQPLTVREVNNEKYELIAGERRFRAAKFLKLKSVPAYILTVKSDVDMLELALVENIQRDNLNPLEEAEGFALLSGKYGLTQQEISKRVGKSRPEVANILRLMKLPPKIREKLAIGTDKGGITKGHARALLSLKNSIKMHTLFNKVIHNKLSVRQTEELVKKILSKGTDKIKPSKKNKSAKLIRMEQEITQKLGSKTVIKKNGSSKGSINIEFKSDKDLKRIINKII